MGLFLVCLLLMGLLLVCLLPVGLLLVGLMLAHLILVRLLLVGVKLVGLFQLQPLLLQSIHLLEGTAQELHPQLRKRLQEVSASERVSHHRVLLRRIYFYGVVLEELEVSLIYRLLQRQLEQVHF